MSALLAPVGVDAYIEEESDVHVVVMAAEELEVETELDAEVVGAEAMGAMSHAEREYE